MSIKNKNAKPANEVKKTETRINIGETTLEIIAAKQARIQACREEIRANEVLINQIVTASIEASGHKIHPGLNVEFDAEKKQFVIS